MRILIAATGSAALLVIAAGPARATLDDATALDMMKKSGCTTCHSLDKKTIGPAYREVALKRKGEKDAVASLEKVVRTGSKGAYGGALPMPPNSPDKIGDADLHALVEWILTK